MHAKIKISFKKFVGVAIVASIGICVVWLFWPIKLPKKPLISALPARMVAAIEIRGFSNIVKQEKYQHIYELVTMPESVTLASQIFGQSEEVLEHFKALYAHGAKNYPFAFWFVTRAMQGSHAAAIYDPRGEDIVVISQVDNIARLYLWYYLWRKDGILARIGKRQIYAVFSGDMLIAATSPMRLRTTVNSLIAWRIRKNLEESYFLLSDREGDSPPQPAAFFLISPDGQTREKFSRATGHGFWLFRSLESAIFFSPVGIKWQSAIHFDNRLFSKLEDGYNNKISTANVLPAVIFCAPATAAMSCEGWGNASFLWQCFNRKLWDKGRPLRGHSQPFTVMAWEALDRGVMAHSDGRFALWCNSALPMEDDFGVPPMPDIAGFLGVGNNESAPNDLAEGVAKIAEFYAAPGGNELYQTVRQETRWEAINEGEAIKYRLRLHPLFFNHFALTWEFRDDFCVFTTADAKLPLAPTIKSLPAHTGKSGQIVFNINFRWQNPEKVLCELRDVIEDKAIRQGFAPFSVRPKVMAFSELILAVAKRWPFLLGCARLEKIPGKSSAVEYRFNSEVSLSADKLSLN